MRGAWVGLAAACAAGCAFAEAAHQWDMPAFRADDFVESIGLNGGPFERRQRADGRWEGYLYAPALLFELGVRYYRAGVMHDIVPANQPELAEQAWLKYGARPILLVDPVKARTVACNWLGVSRDGDFSALLKTLRRYAPVLVAGIEGPNEVNNKFGQDLNLKYKGLTDEEAADLYQTDLYAAVNGDAALKDIPVIMYTSIFSDYTLGGKTSGFDYMNMHSYASDWMPSAPLYMNMSRAWNVLPRGATIRPFMPTECGYSARTDPATGRGVPSQLRTQALNIPMLLAEYFRHGIPRTFLFAIHNTDSFGLLESDGKTKRPAWFALKSFIDILSDATWNPAARRWEGGGGFEPRALRFRVENAPWTLHTLTLQKRSGHWFLLVWNEERNRLGERDLDPKDVEIDLAFAPETAVRCVKAWRQDPLQGAFRPVSVPRVADRRMRLGVPTSVIVLELEPLAPAASAPPPAPELVPRAHTERSVSFDIAFPKTARCASVLVERCGMVAESIPFDRFAERNGRRVYTFTDASHWIHPGLGYPFSARAIAADGTMGSPGACTCFTDDRRYNLAIGDFGVCREDVKGALKPGDEVRFEGEIVNTGDGASPNPTHGQVGMYSSGISLVFWVGEDGAYFGGTTGKRPLAPWACERHVTHDGKNRGRWKAAAGTHVLRAIVDDIGRMSGEKAKLDNKAQRTITVGDYPGVLAGLERAVNEGPLAATERIDGATLELPAGTDLRRAEFFVEVTEGGTAEFAAELSDRSAPPFRFVLPANREGDATPVPDALRSKIVVDFKAARSGERLKLNVRLVGDPNRRAKLAWFRTKQ